MRAQWEAYNTTRNGGYIPAVRLRCVRARVLQVFSVATTPSVQLRECFMGIASTRNTNSCRTSCRTYSLAFLDEGFEHGRPVGFVAILYDFTVEK